MIDEMKEVLYAAFDWSKHYEYGPLTEAVKRYRERVNKAEVTGNT